MTSAERRKAGTVGPCGTGGFPPGTGDVRPGGRISRPGGRISRPGGRISRPGDVPAIPGPAGGGLFRVTARVPLTAPGRPSPGTLSTEDR
ncbi:hypothetical protein EF908_05760 [Streptomyces sp. WAC04770]|nr:hypothetical protein EF908_05760 [Streptomyces sp. WAC04770]